MIIKKKYKYVLTALALVIFLISISAFFLHGIKQENLKELNKVVNLSIERYNLVVPLVIGPSGKILEITNCSEEKDKIENLINILTTSNLSNASDNCFYVDSLLMEFAIYCDQKINTEEIKEFYRTCKNSYPFSDVITLGILSYANFIEEKEWICNETTKNRVMEFIYGGCKDIRCKLLRESMVYYLCKQCNYSSCISYICNSINSINLDYVEGYGELAVQRYKALADICKNE